ncbi:MAG TPA: biotin/lipoyl-containing protein, partial [Actinomycetota bacterium]|nr:biotin/lipoyl-containing protein [Actinomycetota bacterium]
MQVKMPQLGETVVEGTILKWLKQEGDDVSQDEPLFEISTDKVDTEVPSPAAGKLAKIMVGEGETVSVGTDLAVIDTGDGAAEEPAEAAQPAEPAAQPAEARRQAEPVETPQAEPAAEVPAAEAPKAAPAVAQVPTPTAPTDVQAPPDRGTRSQILSPLVRRLAAEHDVDLSQVRGTGTGGRITKNDVLSFVGGGGERPAAAAIPEAPPARPAAPAAAMPAGEEGQEVVAMTHIRKAIAQ